MVAFFHCSKVETRFWVTGRVRWVGNLVCEFRESFGIVKIKMEHEK